MTPPPPERPDPTWLSEHAQLLTRGGLLLTGLVCWKGATLLWESGSGSSSALTVGLMLAAYLAGFALFIAGALRSGHRALPLLIPPTLLLVMACYAQNYHQLQLESGVHTTDVRLYMDYAARVLRSGENPYTADLLDAFRVNRAPFNLTTLLLDGDVTGRLAYPALSFLPFVPLQWLGISGDWLYPLMLLGLLGLFYEGAPRPLRPLVLLPLFFDSRYLFYTLGGVSDVGWALLLVAMLRCWHRPRWRAVLFGLACAFKHQPWIVAPFLLVRLWHEHAGCGPRERLRPLAIFALTSTATFAAINLPFFIWSPSAWLAGVLEPVVAPMITFGQGLSALAMYGQVVIPRSSYAVMMAATLVTLLWIFYRHHERLRLLLWLAPGLMLWFAHRSLTSYWYFFVIPLLYQFVREMGAAPTPEGPRRSWRPTWAVMVGWVLLVAATLFAAARTPSPLGLRLLEPIALTGNHISRLRLELTNNSGRRVTPRFTVQASGQQPFFWRIESGPTQLDAGTAAPYVISTTASFARFELRRGARVTALHSGSASLRQTVLLAPDRSYIYPDSVPNGDFRYWVRPESHDARPAFWGILRDPEGSGTIRFRQPEGSGAPATALDFELGPNPVGSLALDTYLALPQSPLELWVRRPRGSNTFPDPAVLYGLRVLVDHRHVLVLFGDREAYGKLAGIPYMMLSAAAETWTRHRLHLPAILDQLGLHPLPRRVPLPRFEHLDIPTVPLNLELYFARRRGDGPARASFGPLQNLGERPDVARLFADQGRKVAPHIWRGSFNLELGNQDKALASMRQATRLAPRNPSLYLDLGEAEFWRHRWRAALEAFAQALAVDSESALAYKGIGWCHYNLNELDEALLAWQQAQLLLERGGDRDNISHLADTLKGIGLTLLRKGQCERAAAALQRAHSLSPLVTIPHDALRGCRAMHLNPAPF